MVQNFGKSDTIFTSSGGNGMRFLIERLEVQIPDHGQTFCHILVDIFILDETGNM